MEPRISVVTLGVADLDRSYRFYKDGLGLPTKMKPDGGIVVFATTGTRLSLYSYQKLAEDIGIEAPEHAGPEIEFRGITLAHTVRNKNDVQRLLHAAERAGGKIVKQAQDVFWGGHGGYFSDPDGHVWEVNYSDAFTFNPDGSLAIE
ncbi:MAG: VOC family protein [Pirellulales bacterium]|nr:VOC family protein [Pirellulales bacterium]